MPNTFTKIASVTVGSGGASSIDFTSIPSTYTDLCLKVSARTNAVGSGYYTRLRLQINGSTTGYSNRLLYNADGTAASATSTDYITFFYETGTSATANTFSNGEIYIPNYAGSNYKSTSSDSVSENNGTQIIQALNAGLWSNTAAITQLTITDASSYTLAQYSTATLYGIKNS